MPAAIPAGARALPPHLAALLEAPHDHALVVHQGTLGLVLAAAPTQRERIARQALDFHRPLVVDDATHAFVAPFSPGASLAALLQRQAQEGGRIDEELACALLERLALLLMMVHRRTTRRAGVLTAERVWLGFDGDVALTGPFDQRDDARDVWLDVRVAGVLAAALFSGRAAPPETNAPPYGVDALDWRGEEAPSFSARAARILERALGATGHGAAGELWHLVREGPRVEEGEARRRLAALVRGLFPEAHARAARALEEVALLP